MTIAVDLGRKATKQTKTGKEINVPAHDINPLYSGNPLASTFANIEDMKCSIMLHFIRVYTVCKGKKRASDKRIQYFLKFII